MRKGFAIAAFVAILTIAALGVLTLRSATPVSAQEILNRADAAQTAAASQGIQHSKTEVYANGQAIPGQGTISGTAFTNILESYTDLQTGKYRVVVTDKANGKIVSASASDGTYLYTSSDLGPVTSTGAVAAAGGATLSIGVGDAGPVSTIYRIPQPKGLHTLSITIQGSPLDAKSLFDAVRQDPTAKYIGEQTLSDGRKVYAVQWQGFIQLIKNGTGTGNNLQAAPSSPSTTSTLYFDEQTYQVVEQQMTTQQNGKDIVLSSTRQLVQETLPPTARVAWDLSDLKGITIVDDPTGEHGPQIPAPISQQDLAARTHLAYILKAVPSGYTMQLMATPGGKQQAPSIYTIMYRNSNGDNIMISGGGKLQANQPQDADETYTTRSGLKLSFVQGVVVWTRSATLPAVPASGTTKGTVDTKGGVTQSTIDTQSIPSTHAIVQAPDGTSFDIMTNLSREQLKTLAEDLVPLK